MKSVNALKVEYGWIEVFGEKVLFTVARIAKKTVPEGVNCYEVRHDDEGQGIPCEIATDIWVNFWGTILSKNKLLVYGKRNRYIGEEEWNYGEGGTARIFELF